MTYTPNPTDLRGWNTFDPAAQQTLLSGGTVTGGDGRQFVLIDGHATVVGSGSYQAGMAARTGTTTTAPSTAPASAPTATAPTPTTAPTDPVTAPVSTVPTVPVDNGPQQSDAYSIIKQTLDQYGLPSSLADWAWAEIVGGKSQNEVLLDLYQRPEFKQEFGAVMDGRLQRGLSPLTPGEIVTYRNEAQQMMRAVGIPAGFADSKPQLDQYLVKNVSLKELGDRVTDWATLAYNAPAEDRQAFYDQGFGHGDLTAMFMNPDIAEPLLRQQVTAAQLGGASVRSGYGKLTGQQGLDLAALGVDRNQAAQGFGQLVHQQELFGSLNSGETQIGQGDQLAATFGGNAQAQQRIQDRARSRVAAFDGGGGFAGTQQGLTGVGSSGT